MEKTEDIKMEENNNEIKKQENSVVQVIEKTENSEKNNEIIKINTLEKAKDENKQITSKTEKKSKMGTILTIIVITLILKTNIIVDKKNTKKK